MEEDRNSEAAASEQAAETSALPTRFRIRTLDEWLREEPLPLPMLVLSEESPLQVNVAAKGDTAITSPEEDPKSSPSRPSMCRAAPDLWRRQLRIAHIPFSQLVAERSFELPPRNVEFLILVEPACLEPAVQFLTGRASSHPIQASSPNPTGRGGTWNVAGAIVDTADARRQLHHILSDPLTNVQDPYHLWRPDAMVEQHLLPVLSELLAMRSTRRLDVWDLGSGVGRDVAYLARNLRLVAAESADNEGAPFRVIGLDQRYRPRDAATFRSFMRRQGVDDVTECRFVDLTVPKDDRNSPVVSALVEERPACVYAVRYWNRPLFETVNRHAPPGTVVAITHFAKPSERADWPFAHPKVQSVLQVVVHDTLGDVTFIPHQFVAVLSPFQEKHVLQRHELRDLFRGSWVILRDAIVTDNDHGRPLVQFVARKQSEPART